MDKNLFQPLNDETFISEAILTLHRATSYATERAFMVNGIVKRFKQAGSILQEEQLTLKQDEKILPHHRENVKNLAEELSLLTTDCIHLITHQSDDNRPQTNKWKKPVAFDVFVTENKTPMKPSMNETQMNRTDLYTTCYEFPASQSRKPRRSRSVGRFVDIIKSPSRSKSAVRNKLDFDL